MPLKGFSITTNRAVAMLLFCLLLVAPAATLLAQDAPPPPPPQQTLTPDQLDDLVAPIALYPDELVSQVLVASTYPLEVVQAFQWMQKNPGLTGPALTQAAQQQGWDASVQALVVFPDVIKRLNDDVTWTTNLGNAFLAQQQDVMDAVQRMRAKAAQAGKLQSTPQLNVTQTTDNGQPVYEIEPTNPDVIYVPVYDPVWIWGPAAWYPYPHWWWPPRSFVGAGFYFGFGPAINVGFFFGGGWHGWAGWGWHPGWGNHTVIVNNTFIHTYNFNTTHITNVHGTTVWTHDVGHRGGVPYANQAVNNRFRGNAQQNFSRPTYQQTRNNFQQSERMGNRDIPRSAPQQPQGGAFRGMDNGRAAQTHAEHGYGSLGPQRSAPHAAPSRGGGGGHSGGRR